MDSIQLTAQDSTSTYALHPSDPSSELRLAILSAGSWRELDQLCDAIDHQYAAGQLTVEEAGDLAAVAADSATALASQRPLLDPDAPRILAADLLGSQPGSCQCCGGTSHWHNHGQRVCSACHPHPGVRLVTARSAA